MAHLVLLETSGNQAYLFATNRLRQNVGASELTWQSGARWVLEAVAQAGGPNLWDSNPAKRRNKLRDSANVGGYEVILATSGKAMVLLNGTDDDAANARQLVRTITRRALIEAPGLDLCGAVVEADLNQPLHVAIDALHQQFNVVRNQRPGPELRRLQLPPVAPCVSSGLPAVQLTQDQEGSPTPLSDVVLTKHKAAEVWKLRLNAMFRAQQAGFRTPYNWEKAEKLFNEMDWLAVVHADGNGMGETFKQFHEHCQCTAADQNSDYISRLRRFSLALDEATEAAFTAACEVLPRKTKQGRRAAQDYVPIVPLVLGGDDLTVLVDGQYALAFTQTFLQQFEHQTGQHPDLAPIAERSIGHPWFGAAAGVAIIKPHFPFSTAYQLAESLIRSAKDVKKQLGPEGSALDFHILYDAAFTSLNDIRNQRLHIAQTQLYAGPYVTSPQPEDPECWGARHHIEILLDAVAAITRRDPETDRPDLPSGQLHALRNALFQGPDVADGLFRKLMGRYGNLGLKKLQEAGNSVTLYRPGPDDQRETRFLDALSSAPFWLNDSEEPTQKDESHA